MKAVFKNLFSVSFLHEYFADNRFTGFRVQPAKETAEDMIKNGLLFKQAGDGFSVYYDAYAFGKERLKDDVLTDGTKLVFFLELTDTAFYNYTADFGAGIDEMSFCFTNLPLMSCQEDKGSFLHRGKYASAKELIVRDPGERQVFGKLFISADKSLQENYFIRFQQKAFYIRYFLVSDYFLELDSPAVIDSSNRQKFSDASTVTMTNGQKAVCFTSQNMISFNNKAKSSFNLVEHYEKDTGKFKPVRSALPLPDMRCVSKALDTGGDKEGVFFTDIFL